LFINYLIALDMANTGIIIIGAGAAGLMAARELGRHGIDTTILEARDRTGGRILTLENSGFSKPVETGAEFIHGDDLVETLQLLSEAGISYLPLEGDIWRDRKGTLRKEEDFMEGGALLETRLQELKADMPISAFLDQHFPGNDYAELRNSVKGFVEGYDAADTNRASTFALRDEWSGGDKQQYRTNGGYTAMVELLENQCRQAGCDVRLSSVVKKIRFMQDNVEITCADGAVYEAGKVIVTVPIGILQGSADTAAGIAFFPPIDEKLLYAQQIGSGTVIKILLEFKTAFWEDAIPGKKLDKLGWLFSDKLIPTWWSQYPDKTPLFTGWLAGPRADRFKDAEDAVILQEALQALGSIFNRESENLRGLLTAWRVVNWKSDPFSMGAYAYATVETDEAKKHLNDPVNGQVYFAGEALFEGGHMGTVEGALLSGKSVARQILSGLPHPA
jgi:monoamine oxidase